MTGLDLCICTSRSRLSLLELSVPRSRPQPPGLETKNMTLVTRSQDQDQDLSVRFRVNVRARVGKFESNTWQPAEITINGLSLCSERPSRSLADISVTFNTFDHNVLLLLQIVSAWFGF